MIADFIVIESKLGADYYAVCSFQNSAAIRIYRMSSEELVYELESDYSGDAGVAGYMPRMDIAYVGGHYVLVIVSQAEFAGDANKIKMYRLIM